MTKMREAGTLRVQIQDCEYRAETNTVRFTVSKESQFVDNLDLRQFVAWNGEDVVEEFLLSPGADSPCYELTFHGPPSPTSQIKVQVFAELGVGEDTGMQKTLT